MNRLMALWDTTLGKKVVMSVTGIIGILFLITHVISNLLIFTSPEHLTDWKDLLDSTGPALYLARLILLVAVILHIMAAYQLTMRSRAARTRPYDQHELRVASYAARTMRYGGVILAVFILFHILNLTWGWLVPGFNEETVASNVVSGLQVVPIGIFYAVAMVALGMHFAHGIWAVFQTLGINHPAWNRARVGLAIGGAILIAGGFLTIPLAVLFGVLH